ncbi:alpha/beta hydrolase [Chiayiivirga flava]|uniref:Acetyl esterase/lipase n=1 Tax=Chiayiivirga flava TaxID=659595 RepID=A0A7W8D913_9GAMM|nr:alpha/beta hydrolase [Chiayiivirga flava]MBB5209010.1 acetyl esterase/lipase [Chiayiivirga flava]
MTLRRLRALLVCVVAVAASGCAAGLFSAINLGGGDIAQRDVLFDPAHGLQLTVHAAPGADATTPVALFFYGGSWQRGAREDYAFVGRALARCGVTTAVADYRKSPDVTFPAFVEDAARALAWTRAQLTPAAADGSRAPLFLIGHSAGAHVGGLLATDARFLAAVGMRARDLAGAIGVAGPYDFLPITDPAIQAVFGPESGWPATQPINFVDGDEPAFLLLHGTDDTVVWPRNSERLAAKLQTLGEPVELRTYPGVGHIRAVLGFRYPSLAPTLRDTLGFIAARGGRVDPACLSAKD